jgi:hypothetical protein
VAPWKPRQRFQVTSEGREAAQRYLQAVQVAQESGDVRRELEAAKERWAGGLGLRPTDGILLETWPAASSAWPSFGRRSGPVT